MKELKYSVQGEGIPLILLHGWGMGAPFLIPLAKALAEYYQVYLIDLPGYRENFLSTCPDDLETLCEGLLKIVPEKAVWIGWSLGGLIAQNIACLYPSRPLALITLNSSPSFMEKEHWHGIKEASLRTLFNQVHFNSHKALEQFIFWQFSILTSTRSLYKKIKGYSLVTEDALSKGLYWLRDTDLRLQLCQIICPTLMIFGNHDPVIPVEIKDSVKPFISPLWEIRLLDSAHLPFLSHTAQCVHLIRGFLDGLFPSK